jgi:hypothetical protein
MLSSVAAGSLAVAITAAACIPQLLALGLSPQWLLMPSSVAAGGLVGVA